MPVPRDEEMKLLGQYLLQCYIDRFNYSNRKWEDTETREYSFRVNSSEEKFHIRIMPKLQELHLFPSGITTEDLTDEVSAMKLGSH